MYNRPGVTVSPVYSDDATEEQLVDFDIDLGNHASAVDRDGVVVGYDKDWVEDSEGRYIYSPELEDIQDDSPEDDYFESYLGALIESEPDLEAAVQWHTENGTDDQLMEVWNRALEVGDIDKMHELIPHIVGEYQSSQDYVEPVVNEETDEYDEMTQQQAEELDQAAEYLSQQEAGGDYVAMDWDEQGERALNSGDEVAAAVYLTTAAFHRGEITYSEGIRRVLDHYPLEDVSRVYQYLMEHQ